LFEEQQGIRCRGRELLRDGDQRRHLGSWRE
jgi:hypothetical protein